MSASLFSSKILRQWMEMQRSRLWKLDRTNRLYLMLKMFVKLDFFEHVELEDAWLNGDQSNWVEQFDIDRRFVVYWSFWTGRKHERETHHQIFRCLVWEADIRQNFAHWKFRRSQQTLWKRQTELNPTWTIVVNHGCIFSISRWICFTWYLAISEIFLK